MIDMLIWYPYLDVLQTQWLLGVRWRYCMLWSLNATYASLWMRMMVRVRILARLDRDCAAVLEYPGTSPPQAPFILRFESEWNHSPVQLLPTVALNPKPLNPDTWSPGDMDSNPDSYSQLALVGALIDVASESVGLITVPLKGLILVQLHQWRHAR